MSDFKIFMNMLSSVCDLHYEVIPYLSGKRVLLQFHSNDLGEMVYINFIFDAHGELQSVVEGEDV